MNERKKTILIVEDDPNVAKAMSIRLSAAGYVVQSALDGVSGMHLAESNPPDLIIADIFMPIGAGFAMAYRLRETNSRIPFIFVTGSKDARLRDKAASFDPVDFLEKPYDPEHLLRTVRRALQPEPREPGAAPAAPRSLAPPSAPIPSPPSAAARRILVVEDDPSIARSLSIRLQAAGFEVSVAADAIAGARAAAAFHPDLSVLDITMPGGGGFSVAEEIRRLFGPSAPVIFLTANKQSRLRKRAAELGAAGFFEKPYDAQLLVATIEEALANRAPLAEIPL